MANNFKHIVNEFIFKPAKNNLTSIFFWLGLTMIFIGAIFGDEIDKWKYVFTGTGEAILKGGGAILGAGVFAVIMKSSQFTELFQRHIHDVFYRPENVKTGISLIEKWRLITNSLLKEVLPKTHLEASSKIEQQFFNAELEYHYEEYYNSYTITVDKDTNIATVETFSKSTIILSPHSKNPILKQSIATVETFELLALRINDVSKIEDNPYEKENNSEDKRTLRIPLKDECVKRDGEVSAVRLEKVTKTTQNLTIDPYVKVNISRYIKGATVRVKVSGGYKVFFEKFGLGNLPKNHYLSDDGEGYERWMLVEPDGLLLPGQGYILVITPEIV